VPIISQLNVQGLYGTNLLESSLSGKSTLAWPERRLRPGERFETHAKSGPYVEALVEQFLLGQVPYRYKHKSAVLKKLSERSHDSKVWTSERLNNWIKKGRAVLSAPPSSKRAAETSPSDSNTTEGFAVGTDDPVPLDMTIFDDEPSPLDGRPKGTDNASRDAKKAASKALLSSTSKELYTQRAVLDKRAADATARGDTAAAATDKRGALMAILLEKHTKRNAEGMDLARPGKSEVEVVSHRVVHKLKAPARASLEPHGRGPEAPLLKYEMLVVNLIEEAAEVGIYFNLTELSFKTAGMIEGTDAQLAWVELAARSRGFTDSEGKLVVKPADLNPGTTWSRNFLARHSARLSRTFPTVLDLTREKWHRGQLRVMVPLPRALSHQARLREHQPRVHERAFRRRPQPHVPGRRAPPHLGPGAPLVVHHVRRSGPGAEPRRPKG